VRGCTIALPSPTCPCCLPAHFRSRSPYSAAHWTGRARERLRIQQRASDPLLCFVKRPLLIVKLLAPPIAHLHPPRGPISSFTAFSPQPRVVHRTDRPRPPPPAHTDVLFCQVQAVALRVASASLDPREGNLRKSRQLVALPYVPISSYRSFLALTDGDFTRCDAARPKISKLHARLPSPRLSRTPYPCVACPHSPRKHPTMPCYGDVSTATLSLSDSQLISCKLRHCGELRHSDGLLAD
jgi:hypothetical protein